MEIKYLTVEDVFSFHEKVLENTAEDKGLSLDKSLHSAINRIDDHVYYKNLNDLYETAALYAIAIAKGHCFNNGNKRTGMLSMVVFLFINGIIIDADNLEIENIIIDIVEDKLDQTDVANWLKENAKSNSI